LLLPSLCFAPKTMDKPVIFFLVLQKQSMVATQWDVVMQDASLIFVTLVGLSLSLGMMGVPVLANGYGISASPASWHSYTLALIILAASGYLLVLILQDTFSDTNYRSKIISSSAGGKWKPYMVALAAIITSSLLIFLKAMRSEGGYSSAGY